MKISLLDFFWRRLVIYEIGLYYKKWLIFIIIYLCLFVKVSGWFELVGIIIYWFNLFCILFLDLYDKVFYDLKYIELNFWNCILVNIVIIIFWFNLFCILF